jgi:hypothetical protein
MHQTHGLNRGLFREPASATAEEQKPVKNAASPSTATWFSHPLSFPCDRGRELDWTRRDERADDFFGVEDLLSQAYEDAVYAGVIAD